MDKQQEFVADAAAAWVAAGGTLSAPPTPFPRRTGVPWEDPLPVAW